MKDSMTIINQFFYPDVDANAQFAYDLAKGLIKKGFKVRVVCQRGLKFRRDTEEKAKNIEKINGIEIHRLPDAFSHKNLSMKFLRHLLFYFFLFLKLLSFTSKNSKLLVISNPPFSAFIAAILKPFKQYKYFFMIQDVYPDAMASYGIIKNISFTYRLLDIAEKFACKHSEKIFTLGHYMTKRINDKGISKEKIIEIPNWGFDNLSPVKKTENPLIAEMNLRDRFIILYSGNHGTGHEFNTILKGTVELSKKYKDIYFLFIGGGARFNEIKKFRKEHPEANIRTFDYLPFEKLNYGLNLADISLVTMRKGWEGVIVPSKIYGIMAVGSPVVYVGPESDISWTIEKYKCGFNVENGDTESFIQNIEELYQKENLRKKMGKKARKSFEENFKFEKALKKYIDILANV